MAPEQARKPIKPWFIYEPSTTATTSVMVGVVPPLFTGEARPVRSTAVSNTVTPYWGTDISPNAFIGSSDRPFQHADPPIEPSIVLSNPKWRAVTQSRLGMLTKAQDGQTVYARPYKNPDMGSYSGVSGARY